jgi:mycobactin lysine-N-oxygenase
MGAQRFPTVQHKAVFDGITFWKNLNRVEATLSQFKEDDYVVLIGGGGTAAAIAGWFAGSKHRDKQVLIVNSQATLFLRSQNYFENRMFGDTDTWNELSIKERMAFSTRLNRGVVWESVLDVLEEASNIDVVPGSAEEIRLGPISNRRRYLRVVIRNAAGARILEPRLVVNASGFDPWWFRHLLTNPLRRIAERRRTELERSIRDDLSLHTPKIPNFHVPMISQVVGPGLMSLMSLGDMSSRVLGPYARLLLN